MRVGTWAQNWKMQTQGPPEDTSILLLSSFLLCIFWHEEPWTTPFYNIHSLSPIHKAISTHTSSLPLPIEAQFGYYILLSLQAKQTVLCSVLGDALTLFLHVSWTEVITCTPIVKICLLHSTVSFSRAGPVSHESLHPNCSAEMAARVLIHKERLAVENMDKWRTWKSLLFFFLFKN